MAAVWQRACSRARAWRGSGRRPSSIARAPGLSMVRVARVMPSAAGSSRSSAVKRCWTSCHARRRSGSTPVMTMVPSTRAGGATRASRRERPASGRPPRDRGGRDGSTRRRATSRRGVPARRAAPRLRVGSPGAGSGHRCARPGDCHDFGADRALTCAHFLDRLVMGRRLVVPVLLTATGRWPTESCGDGVGDVGFLVAAASVGWRWRRRRYERVSEISSSWAEGRTLDPGRAERRAR